MIFDNIFNKTVNYLQWLMKIKFYLFIFFSKHFLFGIIEAIQEVRRAYV